MAVDLRDSHRENGYRALVIAGALSLYNNAQSPKKKLITIACVISLSRTQIIWYMLLIELRPRHSRQHDLFKSGMPIY